MNKINNNDIKLEHENHEYKLKNHPDIIFTSVTTFVNSFFEPFNEEKISKHLVKNIPQYRKYTSNELIEKWNVARQYGTDVHLEIENWIKDGITPKDQKSIVAKEWIGRYITKSNIETYSEVIVYSKELCIAGTIDVLMMDKNSKNYTLIDWKTSKRIDKKPFRDKKGIKKETANIADCNYNHYALQLSLYRYILEEYYNINVINQFVVQLKDEGAKKYDMKYMKDEIIKMIETID